MYRVLFFCLPLFLVACDYFRRPDVKEPIARVRDSYLFKEDIEGLVPSTSSPEDSASLVTRFIDNWVKQELIVQQAELNLSADIEEQIEKDVKNYRNSKVIYLYEKELIRQKLDTGVSRNEIENYYQTNKSNFELKDYIIKGLYIRLELNTPDIKKAIKWIRSDEEDDRLDLEDYCHKYAVKYQLNPNKWIYFEDVSKEMNLEVSDVVEFLSDNKIVEKEDSSYLHLLKINDYVMKDSISPLEMELENIKKVILNKRKIDLVKKMRNDIYQNALNRGYVEIMKNEEN